MPNDNENDSSNTDSVSTINQEACEKYGITLSEPPTEPVEPYSRYNDDDTVYGFVTEVSHDQKGTEIEIKDWGYCLEDNKIELGFQDMHRSEIIEEVIKSYGLVPDVDFTDMQDDIISWDNSTSSNSNTGGGGNITGTGELADLVKGWCNGKSSELDKAKAIHNGLRDDVGIVYRYYYNFDFSSPEECLKNAQSPGLNCGDAAQLTSGAMKMANLNAYIVLRCDSAHYFTVIEINGTKYYSDLTGSSGKRSTRAWNDVWEGNKCIGQKIDR